MSHHINLSSGGGGGGGTVTSITFNGGLTSSPDPIIAAGTATLDQTHLTVLDGTVYWDTGTQLLNTTAVGTSGWVLTSQGVGLPPHYAAIPGTFANSFPTDSGTATPVAGVLNIIAGTSTQNSGSSVEFTGSGNTVELNVTDANLNTIIGLGSGNGAVGGINNVSLGYKTFTALTNGTNNVAVGFEAGNLLTTAVENVLIGSLAGSKITTGSNNDAVGGNALKALTTGTKNIAIGTSSLQALTTGTNNVCIGFDSGLFYTTTESNNILINNPGTVADSSVIRVGTNGTHTTCFVQGISGVSVSNLNLVTIDTVANQLGSMSPAGFATTFVTDSGTATPSANVLNIITGQSTSNSGKTVEFTGSGSTVELNVSDASLNTTIGFQAGSTLNAGGGATENTALGYQALMTAGTSIENTAIGSHSLTISNGGANTVVGAYAGLNMQGTRNVAIGRGAMDQDPSGNQNVAIGYGAMSGGNTSDYNVAIGYLAGQNYSHGDETHNIIISNDGVGHDSGVIRIGTNGTQTSCFVQGIAGVSVSNLNFVTIDTTTGELGSSAGAAVTIDGNTGSATGSPITISTSQEQSLVTVGAGSNLTINTTDANQNVTLGSFAGLTSSGLRNIIIGYTAAGSGCAGDHNNIIGSFALASASTAQGNQVLGYQSLNGINTGSFNVVIGDQSAANYATSESSNIILGASVAGTIGESHVLRIGNGSGAGTGQLQKAFISGIYGVTTTSGTTSTVLVSNGDQLGTMSSSARFKNSIEDMSDQSSSIMNLRPVTFQYNAHKDNVKQFGLIAEEVNEIMPEIVNLDNEGRPFAVRYHDMVPMLLNELQKLRKEFENYKKERP